ncbi:MAG TPA: ferric reductase-like transmembrane domain-containing protein, partial [Candidatus Dojkabacteria bacterium]
MHSLIRRKLKKYILIIVFQLITLILWIYAKYERGEEYAFGNIPIYLSQIFALWGLIFFSINYFIATRMQSIEYFFGGLDKVYKFHRFIGESAFVMILAHPILLAIDSLPHLIIVKTLFIPFIPSGSFAKSMGIISLYIYAILILITIFRFLPYNIWKLTHKLMGIPFFFAAIHGLMAESDVKHVFILRYWILFWI